VLVIRFLEPFKKEKTFFVCAIRINKIIPTANKKKTGIISLPKPMIVCVNEWASCGV